MSSFTTLPYSGKYLPENVVRATFKNGDIRRVDKTLCGNGFTTAFFNLEPYPGKVNVLIEPNTGVILSKQRSCNSPNVEFRHQNGTHSGPIGQTTRLIVTTPDTFLTLIPSLKQRGVDKICIDEAHAFPQQVSFRPKLRGFIQDTHEQFSDSAIVTVTATPFVRSYVDIRLVPTDPIISTTIEVNNDLGAVIHEIEAYEGPVVIFSNSKRVLMNLRERDKDGKAFVRINLVIGQTLASKILREVEIRDSKNRFFGSVKAFEGLDLDYENAAVFVIQDLNVEAEQFDLTNIIQAINRLRNRPNKVTYSRIDKTDGYPNIYDVLEKVKRAPAEERGNRYKLRNRLTTQELKIYWDCLYWTYDRHKPEMHVDEETVGSYYNKYLTITKGIDALEFRDYLKNRGIEVVIKQATQQKLKNLRTQDEGFYIKKNAELVHSYGLHDQPFTYRPHKPSLDEFFKQFKTFLRYRNYEGNYALDLKEQTLLDLLDNLHEHIERHVKQYCKEKRMKARELRGSKQGIEIQKKTEKYREQALRWWLLLLADLVNTPVQIRGLYPRHHRDYGYFPEMPMDGIKNATNLMRLPCYVFDIKSCAIRILYNLLGEQLPSNIYGQNKRNKKRINAAINSISYQQAKNTPPSTYRRNITDRLSSLGIELADILVNRYFDKPRDEVHLVTTYHEKKIIEEVNRQIFNGEGFRRHDSLVLFREPTEVELRRLGSYKYLGFGGYFSVPEKVQACDNKGLEPNKSILSGNYTLSRKNRVKSRQNSFLSESYTPKKP